MRRITYVQGCHKPIDRFPGIAANLSNIARSFNQDHHVRLLLSGWLTNAQVITSVSSAEETIVLRTTFDQLNCLLKARNMTKVGQSIFGNVQIKII